MNRLTIENLLHIMSESQDHILVKKAQAELDRRLKLIKEVQNASIL